MMSRRLTMRSSSLPRIRNIEHFEKETSLVRIPSTANDESDEDCRLKDLQRLEAAQPTCRRCEPELISLEEPQGAKLLFNRLDRSGLHAFVTVLYRILVGAR